MTSNSEAVRNRPFLRSIMLGITNMLTPTTDIVPAATPRVFLTRAVASFSGAVLAIPGLGFAIIGGVLLYIFAHGVAASFGDGDLTAIALIVYGALGFPAIVIGLAKLVCGAPNR